MNKNELFRLLDPENPRNNLWKLALEMYTVEFPGNKLKIGCKGCRQTIWKWLRK